MMEPGQDQGEAKATEAAAAAKATEAKPAGDQPATSSRTSGGEPANEPGTHLAFTLLDGKVEYARNVRKIHGFGYNDADGVQVRINMDELQSIVVSRGPAG